MQPKQPPFRIVVGSADPVQLGHLTSVVDRHPLMELGGAFGMPVAAVDQAKVVSADLVLLVDESPGLRGRDLLAELRRDLPDTRVIITTDSDPRSLDEEANVAASLAGRDYPGVYAALDAVAAWRQNPQTEVVNRRHVEERRQVQDWNKTFAERRRDSRRT